MTNLEVGAITKMNKEDIKKIKLLRFKRNIINFIWKYTYALNAKVEMVRAKYREEIKDIRTQSLTEIRCAVCNNLLFKINLETFEIEHFGNANNFVRLDSLNKPLVKHGEVASKCPCGNSIITTF